MERPGEQREMVFCHECENEWLREEHGLMCPDCHSEFTEIIEPDNDPRNANIDSDAESDHGHDGIPGLLNHDPWRGLHDDSHDNRGDDEHHNEHTHTHHPTGSHYHFRNVGPGNFSFEFTTYTGSGPQGFQRTSAGNGVMPNFLADFTQTLMGRPPDPSRRPGPTFGARSSPFDEGHPPPLRPRDANNPRPVNPVDHDPFAGLLGAMFQRPAGFGDPNADEPRLGRRTPQAAGIPELLPAVLEELINFGALRTAGDAAYSQEEFDRIVSRLMEQTQTSNAPGPASEAAINNLPKKIVDDKILGDSGKAECSICMDEVNKGEQVAFLPCGHWFHHPCVAAWLGEHDTCPHCRKSISAEDLQNSANEARSTQANSSDIDPVAPGSYPQEGSQCVDQAAEQPQNSASGTSRRESDSGGGLRDRDQQVDFVVEFRANNPPQTSDAETRNRLRRLIFTTLRNRLSRVIDELRDENPEEEVDADAED